MNSDLMKAVAASVTQERLAGLVRAVGSTAIVYAAAKGWIDAGDADWLVGGLVALSTGVWSWISNKPK